MSGATAADYAWFEEQYGGSLGVSGFCITFVRGLTPAEAFDRIGVTAGEGADADDFDLDEYPIIASTAIGGTILIEDNGFAGVQDHVAERLSRDTVTAAVFRNVNFDQQFVYAENGRVVLQFEPDGPDARWGGSERMLAHMRDLGMPLNEFDDPDEHYLLTAFALAERATGVRLLPTHIEEPALIGTAEHLY
ncbi:hypothetical protein GCM10010517_08800 [Streptosporangium fragile]|uniref:Uncharacterized protein n=1 Tax=Streptosporangium fragile TaxID=46186 RepID=A0ABN3VRK4_9ACTN